MSLSFYNAFQKRLWLLSRVTHVLCFIGRLQTRNPPNVVYGSVFFDIVNYVSIGVSRINHLSIDLLSSKLLYG